MSVGEYGVWGPSMSEHEGLQLRHELATLIPGDKEERVLHGMREKALNYLVGSALAGLQSPDEARQLALEGTLHVLRHQDDAMVSSARQPQVRS